MVKKFSSANKKSYHNVTVFSVIDSDVGKMKSLISSDLPNFIPLDGYLTVRDGTTRV